MNQGNATSSNPSKSVASSSSSGITLLTKSTTHNTDNSSSLSFSLQPVRKHPHAGAKDPSGMYWGYVHDPKVLFMSSNKNTTVFTINNKTDTNDKITNTSSEQELLCRPTGYGPETQYNNSLWQHYNLGVTTSQVIFDEIIQIHNTTSRSRQDNITIFCAIYTYPKNTAQTEAIRQTWGKRCDGILFASTETIHDKATVHLPHYTPRKRNKKKGYTKPKDRTYEPQGTYKGIWQRIRSMLGYIYDNFLDEYEYYYFSGDDTYVIIENLKYFLSQYEHERQREEEEDPPAVFYSGSWIHPYWPVRDLTHTHKHDEFFYYMGGGGGYVLNQQTIRVLMEIAFPHGCYKKTFTGSEDVLIGSCLKQYHRWNTTTSTTTTTNTTMTNTTLESSSSILEEYDYGYDSRDHDGKERFFWHDLVAQSEIRARPMPHEKRLVALVGQFWRSQQRWREKYDNRMHEATEQLVLQQQQQQQQQQQSTTNATAEEILTNGTVGIPTRIKKKKMKTNGMKFGPKEFISPYAISFHKIKPAIKMKRYERLFYRSEKRNPILHQQDCG